MNDDKWIKLEEYKVFDIRRHLIWKIAENESEIETPEGYKAIKTDRISFLRKIYTRKFFVNTVPVEAQLYMNTNTQEISYYFEGTPLAKENHKTLKKSIN